MNTARIIALVKYTMSYPYYQYYKILTSSMTILIPLICWVLKVQSCKLCNNKYMFASTQIRNTKIFAFIAVLVFKVLSPKILFINRKDNRNC